jgi:hypothetical protein
MPLPVLGTANYHFDQLKYYAEFHKSRSPGATYHYNELYDCYRQSHDMDQTMIQKLVEEANEVWEQLGPKDWHAEVSHCACL